MKTTLTKRIGLCCAAFGLALAPAFAGVTSTITTGDPAQAGSVKIETKDTNGGLTSTVTVAIAAGDTKEQKAQKIAAALNARYKADKLDAIFKATVTGNEVTVSKTGGGGMTVTIVSDGTGEGDKLTSKPGGGNGTHPFWRWVRSWFVSADSSVPPSNAQALCSFDSPTGPGQELVFGDGTSTLGQIQQGLTQRLASRGYTFVLNHVVDPVNGDRFELSSQFLPDTIPTAVAGEFHVATSPGFADWFGTMGIETDVPMPGTLFCAGDGTLASCPCGNDGVAARGCENSADTGGAMLTSTGTTQPDQVVLWSAGELPSALSIFLQGDVQMGCVPFGDGLRCVGGNLKRIGIHNAVGGTASYPQAGDLGIRAKSAALGDPIPAGGVRYYQVYYRDPDLGFCPQPAGNSWNVTNGVAITWP